MQCSTAVQYQHTTKLHRNLTFPKDECHMTMR